MESKDDLVELGMVVLIYLVGQVAGAICFYKHFVIGGVISWIIANWFVSIYVNQHPPNTKPPQDPPSIPPSTFWGGPHGRY